MMKTEDIGKELEIGDKVYIREDLEGGKFYGGFAWNKNAMTAGEHIIREASANEFKVFRGHWDLKYTRQMIDWKKTKELNTKNLQLFNDLIDVATQALKDGLLSNLDIIEGKSIGGTVKEGLSNVLRVHTGIATDIQSRIDFIKSLYAETFTVQGEDEIMRIKAEAKATLANGVDIWVKEANGSGYINACEIGSTVSITLNLISLKGAKVTQKRGAQC